MPNDSKNKTTNATPFRFRMSDYEYSGDNIHADLKKDYDYSGDLGEIFASNEGSIVHKWHHYFPIYERYFEKFRGSSIRFLEIGVSKGGSLRMWRRYFGEKATIFGIDINPKSAQYDGESGQVRIGSQADPDFLAKVIDEMGGVDVVLDDGSHHMAHIPVTLEALFPKLEMNGIYMIEDLHTAFWLNWGGGLRQPHNFFNYVRELMDDQHKWYHGSRLKHPAVSENLSAISSFDSIVVLEKNAVHRPVHSKIGQHDP